MQYSIPSSWLLATVLGVALLPSRGVAQDVAAPRPVRNNPVLEFLVNAGVRDFGPAAVSGATVVAGSPSGRAGLFAIDGRTGKLKWSYHPVGINGSVSTMPAIVGDVAIAPFGAANPGALIAVSLATGKEVWRGPDPAVGAAIAAGDDLVYILSKKGILHALSAATGREAWQVAFSSHFAPCANRPIVRDGVIYLVAAGDAIAGDATKPAGYYLIALEAKSGREQWRHAAKLPDEYASVCLSQPVVTATTIYAVGSQHLFAFDRASGRDRWAPVEVRQQVEGRNRLVDVAGLVDAGDVLVAMTSGFLMAFDKGSGRTAWQIAGEYNLSHPATAVAGNVLYVQRSPATLQGLDLSTRQILWSFTHATAEPNWPFGSVTPVDGGLWVDTMQGIIKLGGGR